MTGVKFRNGNWWIDYRANGKRIRKKIGPNKTLAMNILRKRKIEIIEGKHLDIQRQNKIKFKDLLLPILIITVNRIIRHGTLLIGHT